jgi:hypothetical protein
MGGGDGAPGRIPDFFIVGHPKCGTTALYEMLRRHPEIYMPDFKEPWFFADDMRPRFQPARAGTVPETVEEYLRLFEAAAPGQRVGEASSSYLRSRRAPARIAQLRPDARIIAIFREPADFLRSLHQQLLVDHVETRKDLLRAVALEERRRAGRKIPRRSHMPQMLMYSDHVRYAEQLRRFHESFPAEQVLVLIYDDFRADNEGTLQRVQRFVGVQERPLEVVQANTSNLRMRSQQLDELVNAVSVGRGPVSRAAKAAVKAVTSQRLRAGAMRATRRNLVYGRAQEVDQDAMLALRRRFRGEVESLGKYLDRDLLGLWGYDRLD